jgi:hypothetical protein
MNFKELVVFEEFQIEDAGDLQQFAAVVAEVVKVGGTAVLTQSRSPIGAPLRIAVGGRSSATPFLLGRI